MNGRWPSLMDLKTAGIYLSLSPRTLEEIVADPSSVLRYVKLPVGGRTVRKRLLARADLEEKLPNFHLYTEAAQMRPDAIARRLQDIETNKKLLVLDSLQKLPPLSRQRRDSIDTWLRELEQIKQDPSVVILLVSELSRGENEVNYRRASLGSFKESGDAEYTSDLALQFVGKGEDTICRLHCVANRHGLNGPIATYDRREFSYWRWVEVPR